MRLMDAQAVCQNYGVLQPRDGEWQPRSFRCDGEHALSQHLRSAHLRPRHDANLQIPTTYAEQLEHGAVDEAMVDIDVAYAHIPVAWFNIRCV